MALQLHESSTFDITEGVYLCLLVVVTLLHVIRAPVLSVHHSGSKLEVRQ